MPSSTFLNLPAQKKARVEQALLDEFSRAPLSQAQVSNIVAQAQIARGAFYRYFDDLNDAYRYLLCQALRDLHHDLPSSAPRSEAQESETPSGEEGSTAREDKAGENQQADNLEKLKLSAYQQAQAFVEQAQQSRYYQLMYWYYHENNASFTPSSFQPEESPTTWAIATLSHAAIRECLLDRENVHLYLARFHEALEHVQ